MSKVHICDYGSGNILSVERALEKVGAEVVRCTFRRLTEALILPMTSDAPFDAQLEGLVRTYAVFLANYPHHARIAPGMGARPRVRRWTPHLD